MGHYTDSLDRAEIKRELQHRDDLIARQDASIKALMAERDALKAERDQAYRALAKIMIAGQA